MKPPFRRTLLAISVDFICRYWCYPGTVEDPRIGESIRNAQAIANGIALAGKERGA